MSAATKKNLAVLNDKTPSITPAGGNDDDHHIEMSTSGGSGDSNPLFDSAEMGVGGAAPDQIVASIASMDSQSKLNFIQSLLALLTPEEKAQLDTVPDNDVTTAGAEPVNPDEQYQMSISRTCKRLSGQPGMKVSADREAKEWSARITSLLEDGWLDEEDAKKYNGDFGKERFSILLESRGNLNKTCIAIETLEKARNQQAELSKSKIAQRFGTARPAVKPAEEGDTNESAQKTLGSRLGNMTV